MRLKKLRHDIPVQGSPERSVFRVVPEDDRDNYFVLEQIPSKSLELKKTIAATLDFLSGKKLARISRTWRIKKAPLLSATKMIIGKWPLSYGASNLIAENTCMRNGAGRRWPFSH